ncbi:hypothetical protein KIPB_014293, partial [Kipferlia bialata]|eukprot:g14293.t1
MGAAKEMKAEMGAAKEMKAEYD